jgi:hypothetical protein
MRSVTEVTHVPLRSAQTRRGNESEQEADKGTALRLVHFFHSSIFVSLAELP